MGQHDWGDLILNASGEDATKLVQEGIDDKHVIFFFPAGAGTKHTPLTGRTDSDQLATNLEIAAQHALAAAHTKTGGDPGAFITKHCELGTGIPAIITTEIERVGQDPFVCYANDVRVIDKALCEQKGGTFKKRAESAADCNSYGEVCSSHDMVCTGKSRRRQRSDVRPVRA